MYELRLKLNLNLRLRRHFLSAFLVSDTRTVGNSGHSNNITNTKGPFSEKVKGVHKSGGATKFSTPIGG